MFYHVKTIVAASKDAATITNYKKNLPQRNIMFFGAESGRRHNSHVTDYMRYFQFYISSMPPKTYEFHSNLHTSILLDFAIYMLVKQRQHIIKKPLFLVT